MEYPLAGKNRDEQKCDSNAEEDEGEAREWRRGFDAGFELIHFAQRVCKRGFLTWAFYGHVNTCGLCRRIPPT